ncbi:C3a anaphylatoxin chemotactic receptor-like [Protopterus annectens]|uniref:C3a anaphylatoxin chemotactic receptor-like n=1 Tax=Protopterus annectens TaxID=7888 RepID=UPI001CFB783B|nr:C3a anaphylatoxin chemotactic receptor-like [Protopterus annectens]
MELGNFSLNLINGTTRQCDVTSRNGSLLPCTELYFSTSDIVDLTLIIIIFLLGVLGNGMVIWVLGFLMKRTDFTIYVLNLAVADFFNSAVLWASVPVMLMHNHWPFGRVFCKIDQFFSKLPLYAGVFLVVAICLERCCSVVSPLWYKCRRSQRLSAVICSLMWLLASLISLPSLIWSETYQFEDKQICFVQDHNYVKVITASECVVGFLLPLILITSSSIIIIIKVTQESTVRSTKLYKTVLVTVLAFLICWTPYQVSGLMHMIELLTSNNYKTLASIIANYSSTLLYLNSCINPIIYIFMGGNLNKKFKESLIIIFQRAFNETPSYDLGIKAKEAASLYKIQKFVSPLRN